MRHAYRPLLASLALVLVACAKDTSPIKTTSGAATEVSPAAATVEARGHSLVRVINAVSTGKPISAQLGDRTLFADVRAGGVSDYAEVETNVAQFSVVSAEAPDGTMLAQADRILLDGNRYSVFVVSQDISKQALRIVRDDVIPDSGKARLRVIHAAPGGPKFDIRATATGKNIFSGVAFLGEAGPADIAPATSYVIDVRAAGESRVLLRIPAFELRRGTATTVVITGTDKLGSFHYTDAMMPATTTP